MTDSPRYALTDAETGPASSLLRDMEWLFVICANRLPSLIQKRGSDPPSREPAQLLTSFPPPPPSDGEYGYDTLLRDLQLRPWERLLLALAIAPHMVPELLSDVYNGPVIPSAHRPEVGLLRQQDHSDLLLPTGQTFVFVYGGYDYALRHEALTLLASDTPLVVEGVLSMESPTLSSPFASGRLRIHPSWLDLLLHLPAQHTRNSLRQTALAGQPDSISPHITPQP